MKKLMIAACAVAFATVAQAANCNWSVSGVTAATAGDSLANYAAFAFVTDAGGSTTKTFTTQSIVDMLLAGTNPYSELNTAYGKGYKALDLTGTVTGYTSTKGINVAGASAETPVTLHSYMVIIDTKNLSKLATDMHYYQVVDLGEGKFEAEGATVTFSATAGNSWQAVPEPTSGLLLLLGVAGLALKRKRA